MNNTKSDISEIESDIIDLQSEDKGIVLQTQYKEFFSTAQILDDYTGTYISVPDTELDITVQSNSRLAVIFTGDIHLDYQAHLLLVKKLLLILL
ncbi:MAG: hypothetical protein ACFE9L_08100 [Candidatus Hodarchaeota archaeon]